MNAKLIELPEIRVSIGDVSRILEVPSHTLRFWEKEFGFFLSPARTDGRQRRYGEKDIQHLDRIKNLLRTEGYSIAGAKRLLRLELETNETLLSPEVNTYIERHAQLV
ncbi:MAG TPA: MerR family transcriptional regulator [Fibrobacteraceae bacterium]|nr:MerR family transcriptional regulator [Fibrobacteraceae bacterium]